MPKNTIPPPEFPLRKSGYFVMVPDLSNPGIQHMIRMGLQPRTFLVRVRSGCPSQKRAHARAKALGAERKFAAMSESSSARRKLDFDD